MAAWFIKASEYVAKGRTRIGFVATNSVSQGEQVAQLWPILFDRHGMEIAFAHRPFVWNSEARGTARVHVVVIGLTHRNYEPADKRLFSYPDMKGNPVETGHGALTAYLFDARTVANRHLVVSEAARPLNGARKVVIGSKPIDGGYLIFSPEERSALVKVEPAARPFLRPFIGTEEFLYGKDRWIAAVQSADLTVLRGLSTLRQRLALVRRYRKGEIHAKGKDTSKPIKAPGQSSTKLAETPGAFHVAVIPTRPFLAIPEVSSELRQYVPIGWLRPPAIPSNKLRILPDATLWEFAVLTSRMHMSWLEHIGGRLESRYQYGIGIVYNTYPLPIVSEIVRTRVGALAQAVLNARLKYPKSSLADLYDPNLTPADLRTAHAKLDAAVDKLYRPEAFATDRDRVEHLFGRYEKMINPLATTGAIQNKRVANRANLKTSS